MVIARRLNSHRWISAFRAIQSHMKWFRRQGLPFPSSRIFPPSVLEGKRQNFLNKYNQRCQRKDVSHGRLMTCLLREYAQFLRKCTYKITSTSLSQTISYDGTRNLAWTHQLQTHHILRLSDQRAVYRTDIRCDTPSFAHRY